MSATVFSRRIEAGCFAALVLCAGIAQATVLEFSGNFTNDDDLYQTTFNVTTAGEVTLQTWSYAGGIAGHMPGIVAGGFSPVLSVFDALGNLTATENGNNAYNAVTHPFGGSCGPGNLADPVTGFCEDIYIKIGSLATGTYTVVLTQYDNQPLGPTLADGFISSYASGTSLFLDANDGFSQRGADWAFEIVIPDSPPVGVPEPASSALLALGLALLLRRRLMQPWAVSAK
jgi:hypothetical protein